MIQFLSRVSTVAVVLALLIVAAPASAATVFPGKNGMVAFAKTTESESSIWRVNPDGSHRALLARDGHSPVWSPSGKRLVFVDGHDRLKVMYANGSGQNYLTRSPGASEGAPAWSRDGARIAFVRDQKASRYHAPQSAVFVVDADGSDEKNVTGWTKEVQYSSPSWSPDGTRLVYEKNTGTERTLVVKNIATNSATTLTTLSDNVDSRVSWSPSGKKILYNDSSNEVYTIWPDGTHRSVISDGDSYEASWSPSGNKIAFIEDSGDDSVSISEEDGTVVWIPVQKGVYQQIHAPSWSPDGTKLVLTLTDPSDESAASALSTLDLTNNETALTTRADGKIDAINWQATR
ncbi:MAG TPA: hypothetical protein VK502_02110 [Candidatus Saccharimonadales bacterium]|nr:hypothetical protein [Candidatus Saccharimonadales bacterium]